MNKDKQIEEMARTLCEDYGECGKCSLSNPECENPCFVRDDCKKLYNAGYRKSSEVAREVIEDAKETLLDYHFREFKKYYASRAKIMRDFEGQTEIYKAITDAVHFAIDTLNEILKKYESEGGE